MRKSVLGVAVLAVFLGVVRLGESPAFADGPVPLAGGTTRTADSDTGNGQRWGRAGGRDITWSIDTPADFSALTWGVVSGTSPSLAFDGAVTSSTTEILSYTAGQSDLNGGMARWTGSAQLKLIDNVEYTIPTRFTLKVSNAATNAPLPLSFVGGGVNPGANVLFPGSFTANLLFEMQYIAAIGGDDSWRAVLDLYDVLPTIPGGPPADNVGPVMTGVSTGFYFTGAGMTIDEHDAHITALLSPIGNDVSFLKIDVPSRLAGIGGDTSDIKNQVTHEIPGTLNQILSQLQTGDGNTATQNDVNNAKNDLQNILLILFGLMPCPAEAGPVCATAKFVKDLSTQASVDAVKGQADAILIALSLVQSGLSGVASQSSVDVVKGKIDTVQEGVSSANTKLDALQDFVDVMSGGGLDVQVVRADTKAKNPRWLVKTTRDGVLVNAALTQLVLVATSTPTAVAQNVVGLATVVPIATGLYDVTLNIPDAPDDTVYLFEAQLMEGAAVVNGSALVGWDKKN